MQLVTEDAFLDYLGEIAAAGDRWVVDAAFDVGPALHF
jgi:hypothetical protein